MIRTELLLPTLYVIRSGALAYDVLPPFSSRRMGCLGTSRSADASTARRKEGNSTHSKSARKVTLLTNHNLFPVAFAANLISSVMVVAGVDGGSMEYKGVVRFRGT